MIMLSLQVDGLREAANRMEEIGISVGHDNTASAFITHDAVERMREAADTIEELSAKLQGVMGTRYNKLFGTPERAARTMEAIAASCQNDDCAACPNRANESCALLSNEGELLEWLRGDAE